MKKGDKITFPQVTVQQLEDIGIVDRLYQNKVLALCGETVTIECFTGGVKWVGLEEYTGIFEIEESVFGFPANWIK